VVSLRQGGEERTLVVRGLSALRGPAAVAQTLYEETPESLAARERAAQARRLAPEPAASLVQGRPTKRERRELDRAGHGWQRRSASRDDDR
jgi:ribosome-associated heat shock protein Hsp15